MSNIPSELKYTKEHVWVRVEGNEVWMGITDYAQDQMGELLFVDLPEVDSQVAVGDVFTEVESSKNTTELSSPVSGTVLESNETLDDSPESINEDPYEAWIVKLSLDDASELDDLLSASEYEAQLEEE